MSTSTSISRPDRPHWHAAASAASITLKIQVAPLHTADGIYNTIEGAEATSSKLVLAIP